MSFDEDLAAELAEIASQGRLRDARPEGLGFPPSRSFVTNDYLGLGAAPLPSSAASGARASRLLGGDTQEHRALEAALAAWVDHESSLVFSSGYAANVGALSSLLGPSDFAVSDAFNHASIIDGLRLSGAQKCVVPHGDLNALRDALGSAAAAGARRRWIVVESYYSMDADCPDLRALASLAAEFHAELYVDEAHALGVFGPHGAGVCAAQGVQPTILVGTFGKALGTAGAFVAGSERVRTFLWNRARSFVFSTGISPVVASATATRVDAVRLATAAREHLAARGLQIRQRLQSIGLPALGEGPIVPVILGSEHRALRAAAALREAGFEVFAVRPPTVPAGTSRLRLTLGAHHTEADVNALVDAIAEWNANAGSSL